MDFAYYQKEIINQLIPNAQIVSNKNEKVQENRDYIYLYDINEDSLHVYSYFLKKIKDNIGNLRKQSQSQYEYNDKKYLSILETFNIMDESSYTAKSLGTMYVFKVILMIEYNKTLLHIKSYDQIELYSEVFDVLC